MFNAILNNGVESSPVIAVDQSVGSANYLEFYTTDPNEDGSLPFIVWDGKSTAKVFYSFVKPIVSSYTIQVNSILHYKINPTDKPYFAAPLSITKFVAVKEMDSSEGSYQD